MDWRIVIGGFIVGVGFLIGWKQFGTLAGALLSVVFCASLFIANWLIDRFMYGL